MAQHKYQTGKIERKRVGTSEYFTEPEQNLQGISSKSFCLHSGLIHGILAKRDTEKLYLRT